jgi:hypothetical protein
MVSLFPWGLSYFRAWRSLRWFLVLLIPVTTSALVCFRKHETGLSLFVGFGGAFIAAVIFVELCAGMASSNWGTHFRKSEPIQYWLQVAIAVIVYLGLSCIGYFA